MKKLAVLVTVFCIALCCTLPALADVAVLPPISRSGGWLPWLIAGVAAIAAVIIIAAVFRKGRRK